MELIRLYDGSFSSDLERGFAAGTQVFGSTWKFLLVVTGLVAVALFNMIVLRGGLDGILFFVAVGLSIVVLLKAIKASK